jgi:hypothetical protein
MTIFKLTSGVAASVFLVTAAYATTIINRDSAAHSLRIVEGGQERIVNAEPSQQFDDLCASSCSLYFDGDPEAYEIAAGDIVSIEDGQLFFEDPATLPDRATEPAEETQQVQ